MRFKINNKYFALLSLLVVMVLLSSCNGNNASGKISGGRDVMKFPTAATAGQIKKSDSDSIPAVITSVDSVIGKAEFKLIKSGRVVRLKYSGATDVRGKDDEVISITQIKIGEVVNINYNLDKKKLIEMKVSGTEWEKANVTGISIDDKNKKIIYNSKEYTYDEDLVIVSGTDIIALSSLDAADELILKGDGVQIDSIIVTKGHGYIQLRNTSYFEGGIIEVGKSVITGITSDMRITVQEGMYPLTVTKGSVSGSRQITVVKNEELSLDLTEFQGEGQRYGSINFKITPENCNVYIDRKKVNDASQLVQLLYGEHEVIVTASGYNTYKSNINVDTVLKDISINLEKAEETTAASTEKSTTNSNTASEKKTTREETTTEETTTVNLSDIVNKILTE